MFRKFQERLKNIKEVKKVRRNSKDLQDNYKDSKNTFKYFSDSKLQEELQYIKSTSPVDFIKMMAAEEILIERGVIEHSIAHEHFNNLKKGTLIQTEEKPDRKEAVIIVNPETKSKLLKNKFKYQDQIFVNLINAGLRQKLSDDDLILRFNLENNIPTVAFIVNNDSIGADLDILKALYNPYTNEALKKAFIRLGFIKKGEISKVIIQIIQGTSHGKYVEKHEMTLT